MTLGIAALALVLVLAAAAALTIGCSPMGPLPAPIGALEREVVGGPFRLTDQEGRVVTSDSFRGRYRLKYLGFTFCPTSAPPMSRR